MSDAQISEFLSRLSGVKAGVAGWRARCPAHGGEDRNLSIKVGKTGAIIVRCWSHGCGFDEIVAAVDMDATDFFPDKPRAHRAKSTRFGERELMPIILRETYIVRIAAVQLVEGSPLPKQDRQRLENAAEILGRIEGAR